MTSTQKVNLDQPWVTPQIREHARRNVMRKKKRENYHAINNAISTVYVLMVSKE